MFLEEKIDLLIEEQRELKGMVDIFLPDLETEQGVIHFLEITKNTFNNYLKSGIFIEGVHFIKDGRKRVFVSEEIIKLKKRGVKGKRNSITKQNKIDGIQQQLGIIPMCRSAV